jgi:hypothetical protein
VSVNADASWLNVATESSLKAHSHLPSALSELLGPVSVRTFFSAYFGRRGLHIPGSMLHRPLFSWKQLNELLNNHKGLPEGAKILTEGKESAPKDYLVLLRDIRRGLTMFFEDIDRHDAALTAFLIRLSRELQMPHVLTCIFPRPVSKAGRYITTRMTSSLCKLKVPNIGQFTTLAIQIQYTHTQKS